MKKSQKSDIRELQAEQTAGLSTSMAVSPERLLTLETLAKRKMVTMGRAARSVTKHCFDEILPGFVKAGT